MTQLPMIAVDMISDVITMLMINPIRDMSSSASSVKKDELL